MCFLITIMSLFSTADCEKLKLGGIAFDSLDTEKAIIEKFRLTSLIKIHSYAGGTYYIESSNWPRKQFGTLKFDKDHRLTHMSAVWSESCTSTTDYMQTLFDMIEKYKENKTLWAKLSVQNHNSPDSKIQEIEIALSPKKKIQILIDPKKSKVEIVEYIDF